MDRTAVSWFDDIVTKWCPQVEGSSVEMTQARARATQCYVCRPAALWALVGALCGGTACGHAGDGPRKDAAATSNAEVDGSGLPDEADADSVDAGSPPFDGAPPDADDAGDGQDADSESCQCAAFETCDPETGSCVDNAPFEPDCSNLPPNRACHGGPRAVILGMHERGLIAMFDPQDGHYLGWFSRRSIPPDIHGVEHFFATQGPDQCVWTVVDNNGISSAGSHAVDRLDTDGSFKDAIIPSGKHFVTDANDASWDVVNSVRSIAFTSDKVYVASTRGVPQPRVSRFSLEGEFEEVVLDDGSVVESLLVNRDGSMVIANRQTGNVELVSPDRRERKLVVRPVRPGQIAYAGNTSILTVDIGAGGNAYLAQLATGESEGLLPWKYQRSSDDAVFSGIAPLRNGHWLISLYPFGVRSLAPGPSAPSGSPSGSPSGQHTQLIPADPATPNIQEFRYFGRACLTDAFVQSRDPAADLPLTNCAAPTGPALFTADFEAGLGGFSTYTAPDAEPAASFSAILESTGPGNNALKIVGGNYRELYAATAFVSLPNLKPSFVEYSVRVQDAALPGAYFTLNGLSDSLAAVLVYDGVIESFESTASSPIAQDWLRIQLRDIDWINRTYDLYVTLPGADANCTRIANDILFIRNAGDSLNRLELTNNDDAAVTWFDDILMK